ESLAPAKIPSEIVQNHALARDPASKKISVFGGSRTFSDPGSSQLHELSADGKAFTKRDLAGAPPPRAGFGSATSGGTLYVVGGIAGDVGNGTTLDDVWA